MYILEYIGGFQILKVCTRRDQVENLKAEGFNTILIDNKAEITVDGITKTYEYKTNPSETFAFLDVVQINNNGVVIKLFDSSSLSHTLVTTNKCNSNCIMCPYTSEYRKKAENVPTQVLIQQIEYLPDNTEHIVVTGGEPTLIGTSFFTIMEMLKNRFPSIVCLLLSNGRIFSVDSIVECACRTFPQYTQIAIPIHGSCAAKHNSITSSEQSFEQTIAGIQKLLSKDFRVEIRIVVFKQNIDDMISIAELIVKKLPKTYVVNFMAAEMCGNAAINKDSVWINYDVAFELCAEAIDLLVTHGINVGIYNFPLCSVPKKYWGLYKQSISGYKIRYYDNCTECCEKHNCGGVFASSYRLAKDRIKPYPHGEQVND